MTAPGSAILDWLPHRPPFRFLTSVASLVPGSRAEGRWRVEGDEPFFAGHFPSRPVLPGVLIAESLAQLSGLVVFATNGDSNEPLSREAHAAGHYESSDSPAVQLAHVDIRLRSAVSPPAELILHSRLSRTFGALWQFEVQACVAEKVVARGMLVLARNSESGDIS